MHEEEEGAVAKDRQSTETGPVAMDVFPPSQRTVGFGPCRALSRRTNIKFSYASLIIGPQLPCLLTETMKMPCNEDVPIHPSTNLFVAQAQLQNKPGTNIETGLKKFGKWYLSYYGHNTTS
jgi:hypothetical protein